MSYDLVIKNGRIIDPETMYDGVANIGIKGDRIAKITIQDLDGKEVLDATGLVVAPGFIDTHSHWPRPIGMKLAARDGRTTAMDLELGTCGSKMDVWYDYQATIADINYGTAVSHELARAVVLDGSEGIMTVGDVLDCLETRKGKGWSDTQPNLEQGNAILKNMDEGLQAGAIGVSSTLGYMRNGVSAREAFEVTKLAAAYGRPTAMHFRGTPGTEAQEVNGIQELLCNAAALGAPAIACHFNNAGYNMVHELLLRMQKRGMNVWGELYPYNAGCTSINAVFLKPENWCDYLGHKYEDTLQDAFTGEFFTLETYHEMLAKEPVRMVVVYKAPESDVLEWMKLPGVAIATDSMPLPDTPQNQWDAAWDDLQNNHPRSAGSCAKTLRLCRDNGLPLMHAISMLSYTPAKHLGDAGLKAMQERGRIQEGCIADITIFDYANVKDEATYIHGNRPSSGIPHVLVSGRFVVKDSESIRCDPPAGKPIRYERSPSKMEPLIEEAWKAKYYVQADFGGTDPKSEKTFSCCGGN